MVQKSCKKRVTHIHKEEVSPEDKHHIHDHGHDGHDGTSQKKVSRPMDITVRFYDTYSRTWDGLQKSLEPHLKLMDEQDTVVNHGLGFVEDKRLTHGISMGAINHGVYGTVDLIFNQNTQEYLLINKLGEIWRLDWTGTLLHPMMKVGERKFTKFLHLKHSSNYIAWTPNKNGFCITKEDFTIIMDSVSVTPITSIIYGNRKMGEEGIEFFIVSEFSLIKYLYQPTSNLISLQDVLKISDIEADNAVIEQYCFDNPQDDKKQWIYLTFKRHCTIIDVTGRIHGTKKNLHDHKITAIVATGSSDIVVTGDEKGWLKMWGTRWSFIGSIQPHSSRVTHLLEHPGGNAVISISRDQIIFAWSFDSKEKLEQLTSPEIVERIAINGTRKSFMTQGPRKLVLWRMNELFVPHCDLRSNLTSIELTWHPDYPARAILVCEDNAIRLINPTQGNIITTALVGPHGNTSGHRIQSTAFLPQRNLLYVLVEEKGVQKGGSNLEILHFDGNLNPAKLRETWKEDKWDTAITAIAIYDFVGKIVVPEKEMSFSIRNQKTELIGTKIIFMIAGRRDGCVCKVDIKTGAMGYFAPCHKGQVTKILVNPELSQFISCGLEPGFRLWKILLNQPEEFMPLLDISWKFPIKHISIARELIGFALSHDDSVSHKLVVFNNLEGVRYDHHTVFAHAKPIISVSGSKKLLLFCTSSLDETIRIWSDKNDLVRILCLNWTPHYAAFGTNQGDIFVGIGHYLHLISAEKYLTAIYRNRVIMNGLDGGQPEEPVTLNTAKSGQDPRMTVALEEQANAINRANKGGGGGEGEILKILKVKGLYNEPQDSQRAKDYEVLRVRDEDLKLIVEGHHPLSNNVPDPHNMTKQEWDDFGKSVFGDEDGKERKFFVSESRQAWINKLKENEKALAQTEG